jgi:hypothetical protein
LFEQLVRPFASRQVTTTRRIVPVKTEDKPEEAKITWGEVGQLPQSVVQPQSTNLENIESVGFNLRGSIDKFNQSSRRSELVDVPIRDSGGRQIGTVTLDRAKEITYNKRDTDRAVAYSNYGYNQNYTTDTPYLPNFTGMAAVADPPAGLRATVPSANVSQRSDTHSY